MQNSLQIKGIVAGCYRLCDMAQEALLDPVGVFEDW